jgi:ADP-ribosylglycohydrolase
MLKRCLLVSLTALNAQQLAAYSVEDRIMGSLLGSVVGDALARPTDLDTIYEIQAFYPGGLTTFKNFLPHDWVVDSSGKKIAPSTANTVIASQVMDASIEGRRLHKSKEAITDMVGRKLVDVFGPHAKTLDPLFDVRGYTTRQIEVGKQLSFLLDASSDIYWWNHLPQDADSKFYEDISQEGDSGALMRAWPLGVVFTDDLKMAKECADEVTLITHRHPTARAAAAAIAAGVASALQNLPLEDVVNTMARAAEAFDAKERLYKPGVKKIRTRRGYTAEAISANRMFTSDMIRYAALEAKKGSTPLEILGDTTKRQDNQRSYRGYLQGVQADEAVAAAVYIFMRHPNNMKAALTEAVNIPRSPIVASLVGALVGARTGVSQISTDFAYELNVLEKGLIPDSTEIAGIIAATPVPEVTEVIAPQTHYRKWLLAAGILAVAGWFAYKKFFTART